MKPRKLTIAALLALGIASAGLPGIASAASYFSGFDYDAINDSSGFTNWINVPDSIPITNVSVTIDINHTWVGDLTIQLVAPDGTTADLMCRVGSIDCSSGFGTNADLSSLNDAYTFEDGGADFWAAAAASSGGTISGGVYGATTVGGSSVSLATTFAGLESSGLWGLNVFDGAGGDTGELRSWLLDIDTPLKPVPVPAAVWLFGSGLIGLVGIARRKKTA